MRFRCRNGAVRKRKRIVKKKFPKFYSVVSKNIAIPMVGAVVILYISDAIWSPASIFYPLAITALGVTVGLAGVCFAAVVAYAENDELKYAGEKFTHAAVLIIQSIMLIYIRDSVGFFAVFSKWLFFKHVVSIVAGGILPLVSIAAGATWYWGFESLNSKLWRLWEQRDIDINKLK